MCGQKFLKLIEIHLIYGGFDGAEKGLVADGSVSATLFKQY
jgi:hypothetical protein